MRKLSAFAAFALFLLGSRGGFAATLVVNNFNSGWVTDNGVHSGHQNYISGPFGGPYASYFSFDLSGLSGSVTSADFHVSTYDISAPGTLSLYATSLAPAQVDSSTGTFTPATYSAIVASPVIATVSLDPNQSDGAVSIAFNSTGVSWLQNNEGSGIVLGGYYDTTPGDYAFGFSRFTLENNLEINAAATPEPTFTAIVCVLFGGLAAVALRRGAATRPAA